MQKGAFVVSQWDKDPREIHFQTISGVDATEEQLTLKSEIERALAVLQALYHKDEANFRRALLPLLKLAQCGLVGDSAQPEIARRALVDWKNELTIREAGTAKNAYMRRLGAWALGGATLASLVGMLLVNITQPNNYSNLAFMWTGCMIGVWLSFGMRKTVLCHRALQNQPPMGGSKPATPRRADSLLFGLELQVESYLRQLKRVGAVLRASARGTDGRRLRLRLRNFARLH